MPIVEDTATVPPVAEGVCREPAPEAPCAVPPTGPAAVPPPDDVSGAVAHAALLPLEQQQRLALHAIMSGASISEAARRAGVGRATLYRWRTADPVFMQALESWRVDQCNAELELLAPIAGSARQTVADAIDCGDAKLAMRFLERMVIPRTRTIVREEPAIEIKHGWVVRLIDSGNDAEALIQVLEVFCELPRAQAEAIVGRKYVQTLTGPMQREPADLIYQAIEEAGGRAELRAVRCVDRDCEVPAGKFAGLIAGMPDETFR